MFRVETDLARKRLVLHIIGLLTDEEARGAADAVLAAATKLPPPFDVINDLSQARPLSQTQLAEVRRATAGLVQLGMRRVVRVVGVSGVAQMQFSRESQTAAQVSAAGLVASLDEAHALLDRSA